MAAPTKDQKRRLDNKYERVERHRRAISGRKGISKGVSKKEFHSILERASQPIEKPESDSEQS